MKRISITDFNGGMIDAADPMLIPDNAMVLVENYEYIDNTGLKIRKGLNDSPLQNAGMSGIGDIAVWYPANMPADSKGDSVLIFRKGQEIGLLFMRKRGVYGKHIAFSDVSISAGISIFIGSSRVLVADGVNPGRFIQINKDNEIEAGVLGIRAPLSPIIVSGAGSNNRYTDIVTLDTGMGVERGNILQYCYTFEDKYGSESNPSPVTTQDGMTYKYPDPDSITGFRYYWYSTVISGMSTANLSNPEKALLKYYNIYRRDIEFREGTIDTAFQLVDRIPIDAISMTDSSDDNLAPIDYTKSLAPPSVDIVEAGRVVFLGGVKPPEITFPHPFDRYVEMGIHNNNNIDYVNPIIQITLNSVRIGIDSWRNYLSEPNHKIRIYMQDAITPVPVYVFRYPDWEHNDSDITLHIKPAFLNRNTKNIFYIAIAETASGVPAQYNTLQLGRFPTPFENHLNYVYDINRPLNAGHKICTNMPYSPAAIGDKGYLFNLANMLAQGNVRTKNGSSSVWTPSPNNNTLYPYSYEMPSNGTHVKYELPADLKLPLLVNINIDHTPRGWQDSSAGLPFDTLIEIGNMKIVHLYLQSSGKAYLKLVTHNTTNLRDYSKPIYEYPSTGARRRFWLTIYITATSVRIQDHDVYSEYGLPLEFSDVTLSVGWQSAFPKIALNKNVYLFRPQVTGSLFPLSGENRVLNLNLMEIQQGLSPDEISRYMLDFYHGKTFAREPLGANLAFEKKEFRSITEPTNVMWSDLNGSTFSSLDFKKMSEPVIRIIAAPSFLKQQYESTLIVFGRNRVTRIVLNADMTASNSTQVEEHVSGGLYSPRSLVSGGSTLFWLSEDGVMGWTAEGLSNLSKGIINIPMGHDYVGAWVAQHSQYLLHSLDTGTSYVYHVFNGKWTTFTGLHFIRTSNLNLGKNEANKLLLLQGDGNLKEYPGLQETTEPQRIITKEFYTGNVKALRFRCLWERGKATSKITARTFNHRMSDKLITRDYISPKRYEWIYLPNGLWGEMLQFSIDNATALSKIDIDLRED